MYIPYEIIGNLFNKFIKSEKLKKFFYEKKIEQNVNYIEHNKINVLKRLKKKLENEEKLSVVFYIYDETKWKCQTLYELMDNHPKFDVKLLVTKPSCIDPENPSYVSDVNCVKTYRYFKEKNMKAEYAYDIQKSEFIPFKHFEPDIIIYQHPWYVKTEQGPVICSKFALTCYVPYYFPVELSDIDYKLRFHRYVENYYLLDDYSKEKCLKNVPELQGKLKVVGYPYLDYFNAANVKDGGNCIIYAPHWTIADNGIALGTFKWSGKFILEYAKSHPEISWIFKPHPLLKKALKDFEIMSDSEIEKYYSEWESLGIKYESGDYLSLFEKSNMMITDCGSFLGEYFVTGKPLIHLMSEKSVFKNSQNPILKTYYRANNLDELSELLARLPQNDTKKELRIQILEQTNFNKFNSSENIINDILDEVKFSL